MSAAGILLGLLNVMLYCAIVIFVAFVILWLLRWVGIAPDGDVLKWGKIVVGLLCAIVIIGWLLSLLGAGGWHPPLLFRN